MAENDKVLTCDKCAARFEGEDAAKALKTHKADFHPAGAPTPVALREPAAIGKDFGPAVTGLAGDLGDLKTDVEDHGERIKALEDGTRSDIDLDRLAEQLVDRVQARLTAPATPAAGTESTTTPTATETTYADLQGRAKELGLPATGSREVLEEAIAAEEKKTGSGT